MAIKRFPAELEYKRNPSLLKEVVHQLHNWVKEQPHLPAIEEEDVIVFLASCKFDNEFAKKTIEFHYTFKTHHPELFYDCDPLQKNNTYNSSIGFACTMPGIMQEGSKLMYFKFINSAELLNYNLTTAIKIFLCTLELMIYEEGAVTGWEIVYDMDDTTFSIMSKIRPLQVKTIMTYLQEAFPVQLKGIHIIRPKSFVVYLTALVKPFLKKSVAETLHVHNNLEDFYKFIPKKHLPNDVGGEQKSIKDFYSSMRNKLVDNREILLQRQELKSNESLRPKEQNSFWKSIWG